MSSFKVLTTTSGIESTSSLIKLGLDKQVTAQRFSQCGIQKHTEVFQTHKQGNFVPHLLSVLRLSMLSKPLS